MLEEAHLSMFGAYFADRGPSVSGSRRYSGLGGAGDADALH